MLFTPALFFRFSPAKPRGGFRQLVNDLYYAQPCEVCGGFHNAVEGDILISPDIIENFLRKLYGSEFDYSTEIEPTIF